MDFLVENAGWVFRARDDSGRSDISARMNGESFFKNAACMGASWAVKHEVGHPLWIAAELFLEHSNGKGPCQRERKIADNNGMLLFIKFRTSHILRLACMYTGKRRKG